jgi:hypothetical protein
MITLPAMALLAVLAPNHHAPSPAPVSSTPIWTSAVAMSRHVTLAQRPAPISRPSAHRGSGINPVVLGALIGAAAGGTIGFLMSNCTNGCDERGIGVVPGVLIGAPAGALFAAFAR